MVGGRLGSAGRWRSTAIGGVFSAPLSRSWGPASGPVRGFPSSHRNCLENRNEFRIGVPKAARRGEEESIGRLLAPKKRGRQAFSYFPNSFSRHFRDYTVSRPPRITAEPRSNRLGGLTLPFPPSSGIRLIVPHE